MKIQILPPPNYAEVLAAFPAASNPGTIFAYAPHVYVPKGNAVLSESLQAHEAVHIARQGSDPSIWWRRYIDDPKFRFDEELAAHIAEYRWFDGQPRPQRRQALRVIAQRLASKLYGNMVTVHRAKQMITGRENPDGS